MGLLKYFVNKRNDIRKNLCKDLIKILMIKSPYKLKFLYLSSCQEEI